MPQGLPSVIPNEVITSSHINSIADRVVGRFATPAERDTAITTPTTGMAVSVAGVLQLRVGSSWVDIGPAPRIGCGLTCSALSIPTGIQTDVTWQAELYDTHNFHAAAATAVVIPPGLGGIYTFSVMMDAGGTLNGASNLQITGGASIIHVYYVPSGNRYLAAHGTFEAGAGGSITVRLNHAHSTAANFAGRFHVARISV